MCDFEKKKTLASTVPKNHAHDHCIRKYSRMFSEPKKARKMGKKYHAYTRPENKEIPTA